MIASKIKIWARIGQIAYWLFQICNAFYELHYENFEPAGTTALYWAFICLIVAFIFSEAIVRLICYFAELLEDYK